MPTATLTSRGRVTLPKRVRELLRLDAGDTVDFIVGADGIIHVRASRFDVRDLRGLLRRPGRKPVSLAKIDETLRTGMGRRT